VVLTHALAFCVDPACLMRPQIASACAQARGWDLVWRAQSTAGRIREKGV